MENSWIATENVHNL